MLRSDLKRHVVDPVKGFTEFNEDLGCWGGGAWRSGDCVISKHAPSCNRDITAAFLCTELEQQRPPSLSSSASPVNPLSSTRLIHIQHVVRHAILSVLSDAQEGSGPYKGWPTETKHNICWSADVIRPWTQSTEHNKAACSLDSQTLPPPTHTHAHTHSPLPPSPNTPISPLAQCPDSSHRNAAAPSWLLSTKEAPSEEPDEVQNILSDVGGAQMGAVLGDTDSESRLKWYNVVGEGKAERGRKKGGRLNEGGRENKADRTIRQSCKGE